MKARHALSATLALALYVTEAHSGEPAQQPMAVAEFVKLGILSHLRTAAEVCTKHIPSAKADWERMLDDTSVKVDRFTRDLLGKDPFAGLDKELIPSAGTVEVLKAVETMNGDLNAQIEKGNPDVDCPKMLKNFQGMSDEFLKAGVTQALAGVQAMLVGYKSGYIK